MSITYEYVEEIDSTNNELKRRAVLGGLKQYQVLSAGAQTGGRGRSGHEWSSPKGSSVSTSMILFPGDLPPGVLPRITPLAAVAVAETLEELYGLKARIKWPNDVLVNDKKICGILNEFIPAGAAESHVIVGIGVNVHIRDFPAELSGVATSIDLELEAQGKKAGSSREEVVRGIWSRFVRHYEDFLKVQDLSVVLDYYNERLINKDRTVRILDPAGEYEGVAKGMDETGALHVFTDQGEKQVDSGEVSVRGIGGYV